MDPPYGAMVYVVVSMVGITPRTTLEPIDVVKAHEAITKGSRKPPHGRTHFRARLVETEEPKVAFEVGTADEIRDPTSP